MQYHSAKFKQVRKVFPSEAQNNINSQSLKQARLNTLLALPARFLTVASTCKLRVEKARIAYNQNVFFKWDEHSYVQAGPLAISPKTHAAHLFETHNLQKSAALLTSHVIMHEVLVNWLSLLKDDACISVLPVYGFTLAYTNL